MINKFTIIKIICLILIEISTIYPQAHWVNISGQLPGGITTVSVNPAGRIFISTNQNKIYRSDDYGINWIKLNFQQNYFFESKIEFFFPSNHEVVTLGGMGFIYYSSDNGETWQQIFSGFKNFDVILSMIKTTDGKLLAGSYTGCLSCTGGGIYSSTNNGMTWQFVDLINNRVQSFEVSIDNSIYAAAYPGVYKSTDNGLTWHLKNNGMQTNELIKYLTITNEGNIFAATEQYGGLMYESTDNGESWIQVNSGLLQDEINGIISLNDEVFALYNNEGIYKFQNSNWTKVSLSIPNFFFNSISVLNNNLLTGTSGGIFKSTDSGNEWSKFTHSLAHLYISSLACSQGKIYAGTEGGGIYMSSDEGESWEQKFLFETEYDNRVSSIQINSDSLIFASVKGYVINKSIYVTSNQGITWNHLGVGHLTEYGITGLFIDSENKLYAGEFGTINFSSDNGSSWTTCPSFCTSWIYDIAAKPQGYIFAATYGDGIFRSDNQGNSFFAIGLPNQSLFSVVMDSSGYIFTGGADGLYQSTNNGTSWEENVQTTFVRNLLVTTDNKILAATGHGFYYSMNQGNNWHQLNEGLENQILISVAIDENQQIYVGSLDGVYKLNGVIPVGLISFNLSLNGNDIELKWSTATETNNRGFEIERSEKSKVKGQNWEKIGFVAGNGTTTEPNSYSFTDKDLLAGKYSYRLKQIDFNGSFEYSYVVEITVSIPDNFALYQNYPNPFNPVTKIKFGIPSVILSGVKNLTNVSLKVYDILGREVAVLVNEFIPAGVYEVEFNAGSLSSGVYFYTLTSNSFTDTKKLILLR